jgi:hypothetical protein
MGAFARIHAGRGKRDFSKDLDGQRTDLFTWEKRKRATEDEVFLSTAQFSTITLVQHL